MLRSCAKRLGGLAVTMLPGASRSFNPALSLLRLQIISGNGNVHFSHLLPGFMLGKRTNSNITMKFAQLHYFLSQNVGGTKDIMSSLSKSLGDMSRFKLGPCLLARPLLLCKT